MVLLVNCQLIIYSLLLSHIRQLCKSDNSLRKLHYTQKMSFLFKKNWPVSDYYYFFLYYFWCFGIDICYYSPKKCSCKTAKRKSTAVFSFIETKSEQCESSLVWTCYLYLENLPTWNFYNSFLLVLCRPYCSGTSCSYCVDIDRLWINIFSCFYHFL